MVFLITLLLLIVIGAEIAGIAYLVLSAEARVGLFDPDFKIKKLAIIELEERIKILEEKTK